MIRNQCQFGLIEYVAKWGLKTMLWLWLSLLISLICKQEVGADVRTVKGRDASGKLTVPLTQNFCGRSWRRGIWGQRMRRDCCLTWPRIRLGPVATVKHLVNSWLAVAVAFAVAVLVIVIVIVRPRWKQVTANDFALDPNL